jgi:hypothetical protein
LISKISMSNALFVYFSSLYATIFPRIIIIDPRT